MQLTLWTYEGPPHVGAMRVATAMQGLHYVLHAPQGDTYADLLFTMIERRDERPPVTYTTFQARDLGGDTAELFKTAARDAYERFQPQAMIVGASCTAELIQDDPGGLARALDLPVPVVPLELPAYQKKENWGAAETFYQLRRAALIGAAAGTRPVARGNGRAAISSGRPRSASAIATTSREIVRACSVGSASTSTSPPRWARRPRTSRRLGDADFNVVLYPEIARPAASMARARLRPAVHQDRADRRWRDAGFHRGSGAARRRRCTPRDLDAATLASALVFALGRLDLSDRQARLHLRRRDARPRRRAHRRRRTRLQGRGPWHLHAANSRAKSARPRSSYGVEALITDDYLEVEARVARAAARTGARHADGTPYRQAAWDSLRGDFGAGSCAGFPGALLAADGVRRRQRDLRHLGPSADDGSRRASADDVPRRFRIPRRGGAVASRGPCAYAGCRQDPSIRSGAPRQRGAPADVVADVRSRWSADAEKELRKIPFFVRGKARRNTERFAQEHGRGNDNRRDALRCQSPLRALSAPSCVLSSSRMDSHLASAVARARGTSRREFPGLDLSLPRRRRMGHPRGASTRCHRRHRARRHHHRHDAVSGGARPARCCRRLRRGGTIATPWSAACRRAKSSS